MAGNVSIEQDAADNWKPSKKKSCERIDGIVALVMGLDLASREVDSRSIVCHTGESGTLDSPRLVRETPANCDFGRCGRMRLGKERDEPMRQTIAVVVLLLAAAQPLEQRLEIPTSARLMTQSPAPSNIETL